MGSLPKGGEYSHTSQHLDILSEVIGGSGLVENSLVRSYKRSFNGFAAMLTNDQRQKLAGMKEVVSVFPNTILKPQTTRSWDFMGFNDTTRESTKIESDIIVGVIDSGIWPESDSFNDTSFGPPPKKWKGICSGGPRFTCNNKLIGARFYVGKTARDLNGHGSHTASTAAGNKVNGSSFYGIAEGVARGAVPSARIAAYNVCDLDGCSSDAVLATFDDAIADGVDIITISLGGEIAIPFIADTVAIGAFHAMAKGILTSQSVGNWGPDPGITITTGTIVSTAPWKLSVAASTIDRHIVATTVLGNGKKYVGNAVNAFTMNGTQLPIVYGKQVTTRCNEDAAGSCVSPCLDEDLVKGKIVMCDLFLGVAVAFRSGAAGVITIKRLPDLPEVYPLPAIALSEEDYGSVKAYYSNSKEPVAVITKSEGIKDSDAPVVASFSRRGPNRIVPDIMKPDVSAPGVAILAAFSGVSSPSVVATDKRRVSYSILSGTSMACPHAAGVAAYVKSVHPKWPPAAIKSAIMTTAWPMNNTKKENGNAEFGYGSGHINPVQAINPGLVYEATKVDYIKMLCGTGLNDTAIQQISGDNSTCKLGSTPPKDLNYPSMTAQLSLGEKFWVTFNRTVTNVGFANSTYKAQVSSVPNVNVKVDPEVLSFKSLDEKKSFVVTVYGPGLNGSSMASASLTWSDGTHFVRSPIVVHDPVLL